MSEIEDLRLDYWRNKLSAAEYENLYWKKMLDIAETQETYWINKSKNDIQ